MTFNLVDSVYQIARSEVKTLTPDWRWMVVTSTDPLRIRFDAEDDPLDLTPDAITSDLQVGDRVLVKIQSGQLPVVLGKSGTPQYIYAGAPVPTSESALILRRVVADNLAEYWFQAGNGNQANIIVRQNGDNHSIFRVGRDGQLAMQTFTVSGTIGAIRPLPFATQMGRVSLPAISNGTGTSVAQTFSSGRFTTAPYVFVSTNASTVRLTLGVTGVSTSGFTFRADNWSGTNAGAQSPYWFAIQMEV